MRSILFINGHLNAGGVERSLVDVLQHIDYTRYKVDLLLLQGTGDYADEIPSEVNIHAYDTSDAYGPLVSTVIKNIFHGRWFHALYRIITQFLGLKFLPWVIPSLRREYDTAIAYRSGICTDLLVEAVKSSNKISWWHHGEMNLGAEEQCRLYSEYKKIQHIIAVSDCSAALLRQYFPEVKDKVRVIPNMLCADAIISKATDVCGYSFQTEDDKLHIVSVGRLSPEKNMCFCVSVAKALKEQSIPFEWILVGDGEEHLKIKKKIQDSAVGDSIRMVGSLSNPYPLMQSADLLFHPSLVESQGLTILEAMALETPVICVKSAGPSEFIRSGENGIMIQNDAQEAAVAIMQLSKDVQLRKSIAEKAAITINAFNQKTIIQKIETLL